MNNRAKKLSAVLRKGQAFYASSPSDIFYLSGFTGTFARIIINGRKQFFITDARYKGGLSSFGITKDFDVIITRNLKKDVKSLMFRVNMALVSRSTGLSDYLMLKENTPVAVSPALDNLRMIKDRSEIGLIRKSVSICESGFRHVVSMLKPGVTEKDLALEFDYFTRKNGADCLSFDPIIAFGPGSAVPHHKTSGAKLRKNTLILMDAGVKYRGYCSDLTRCIAFGIIQTRLKEIAGHYNIVKSAKEAAVLSYKKGLPVRSADAKARFYLKKQGGFDRYFTHSLGHGMGLDIHEPPSVNAKDKSRFLPGMVFSCEPGIYMEGRFGIRIEDDYLVTDKGPEKLGSLKDELIITD